MTMTMTYPLSPHFSWVEAKRSVTADAKGIDNTVPGELHVHLGRSAQFMECVRSVLGNHPIRVTSWYRCPELNEAIGGSKTSAHMKGLAMDFKAPGSLTLAEAFDKIAESNLPFDQLIIERTASGSKWIHVGLSIGKPRREMLTAQGDTLGGEMIFRRVLEG